MAVIDAQEQVLGRLCTSVAKRLLNGEETTIVNAEKVRISGNKAQIVAHYKQRWARGKNFSGPKYPRAPDMILKRSVRGMLDYRKSSGKEALKRLKVYVGVPAELKDIKMEDSGDAKKPPARSMYLGEVSRELGSGRL